MLEQDPGYIGILFIITTLITILIFVAAAGNSKTLFFILLLWVGLQSIPAIYGFYTVTNTFTLPPRFALLAGPPFLVIFILFLTPAGRRFIDKLDAELLTWLQTVRIPVEAGLWLLFIKGTIPELMTFEGRNFDILAGLTAPVIVYLVFINRSAGKNFLLAWNIFSLLLVLNIIVNAILAAPTPFQQWGFEQPNTGLLHFPFIWLPACIVPLVVLSHLAVIRQIMRGKIN